MSSLKGLTYRGKLNDTGIKAEDMEFVTVTRKGPSKMALDVSPMGVYQVGASNRVAEAGSTASNLQLTGHDIKVGDIIRFVSTSNTIEEEEISVAAVVDANNVTLDGVLSASLSNGDTFNILRPRTQLLNGAGATAVGLQIDVDSGLGPTPTNVLDDQVTPSNTVPIPVRIYGASANINITSEDLNVQLSHIGANADSVRIGDGTETANVNASNELQVADDTARTSLASVDGKMASFDLDTGAGDEQVQGVGLRISGNGGSIEAKGQLASASSIPVVVSTEQEAILNAIKTAVEIIDNAIAGAEMQVDLVNLGGAATEATLSSIDTKVATETTLSALNAKFSSLGQKASASSAPVVLSSEQQVILAAIQAAVEIIDNAIAGSEMQVDLVDIGGAATETTLSAINTKLPTALGQQNKAGSLSVTIASDQDPVNTNLTPVDFLDVAGGVLDTSSTNIPAAGVSVVASLASNVKKIQIIEDIGEFMALTDGADVVLAYLPLGGGEVEVSIASGTALKLASKSGATISVGKIAINFLG